VVVVVVVVVVEVVLVEAAEATKPDPVLVLLTTTLDFLLSLSDTDKLRRRRRVDGVEEDLRRAFLIFSTNKNTPKKCLLLLQKFLRLHLLLFDLLHLHLKI
jgi:hypothetical protein